MNSHATLIRLGAVAVALVLFSIFASADVPKGADADPNYISGANSDCAAWKIVFLDLGFFDLGVEIAEEGWVWANGTGTMDKFREASGVVTKSKVAHNDTPANHFSHDWNVDIRVDPGQEGVLSNVNGPNSGDAVDSLDDLLPAEKIEMEWETGVLPSEKSGDGANPYLPRWVLPNLGDRVWTDGHWVFDCGHAKDVAGVPHFRTEIHPGRALASMRSQAATIPGSGSTPVPVTATDLYIHGRGAFMVQQLECGIDTILVEITHSCPIKTTPIDELYTFDICLPPKPAPWATVSWAQVLGPGDDGFGPAPEITEVAAAGGCLLPTDEFGNDFDDSTMLHVEVDLRGSGIAPEDVYSRKITAGWVYPPSTPLPHLSLSLNLLDLHADHEGLHFDGEFTFWWMGVDKAPADEWHRLVNYEIPTYDDGGTFCFEHTNHLNDMDDDHSCGNGELQFSGPAWDFYLEHDKPFTVHTSGFEQDCYDDHFGSGHFSLTTYIDCHFGNFFQELANDWGNNDALPPMDEPIGGPGIDPLTLLGEHVLGVNGEFDFYFDLASIPLTDEDDAELAIAKSCSWDGEVALAGEPFTCTISVTNSGPGLPRNVVVGDTLTTTLGAADYQVGQATFHIGSSSDSYNCGASTPAGFSCAIGTVPVGGSVTIEVEITPAKPGSFSNDVTVSTDSTESDTTDNGAGADVEVYLPVPVDISPGSVDNPVKLGRPGILSVAIITDSGFDATELVIDSACFGDAEDESQRTCDEVHGQAHYVDADRDKDVDIIFHFRVEDTGIDLTDTTACLKGMTVDGISFYGCDLVRPQ